MKYSWECDDDEEIPTFKCKDSNGTCKHTHCQCDKMLDECWSKIKAPDEGLACYSNLFDTAYLFAKVELDTVITIRRLIQEFDQIVIEMIKNTELDCALSLFMRERSLAQKAAKQALNNNNKLRNLMKDD
uniref:Uncharacterized protein n=1 Tax=Meloidogyne enterolobii TaxID=390850 RepID=A0A6V7XB52_MELEN|nr:unnamed protein product [Meloidogyne enterolobii]